MRKAFLAALVVAATLPACQPPASDIIRGRGLEPAVLTPEATARAYEASLAAAFELTDPTLVLLVHPQLLPRREAETTGGPMKSSVVRAMRANNLVAGTCEPGVVAGRQTPRCAVERPGYVVRFTEVLQAAADTFQLFVDVQKYDTPSVANNEPVHFENIYKLVRRGERWNAVQQGRVPRS